MVDMQHPADCRCFTCIRRRLYHPRDCQCFECKMTRLEWYGVKDSDPEAASAFVRWAEQGTKDDRANREQDSNLPGYIGRFAVWEADLRRKARVRRTVAAICLVLFASGTASAALTHSAWLPMAIDSLRDFREFLQAAAVN